MKTYIKYISAVLLIGAGIWMFGCSGGDDLLDEDPEQWDVSVSPTDGGKAGMFTIDVNRSICDENGTLEDALTVFGTEIRIDNNTGNTTLVVDGYRVTFEPVAGEYYESNADGGTTVGGNHTIIDPPNLPSTMPDGSQGLNNIERRDTSWHVSPNSTYTQTVPLWNAGFKLYYMRQFLKEQGFNEEIWEEDESGVPRHVSYEYLTTVFDYNYKVTLFCTISGDEEKELSAWGTITFGEYDRCSSGE